VILDRDPKRPVIESELFDQVIGRAPRFHDATLSQPVDRLMMGAVYFCKAMRGGAIVTEWLNIVIALPDCDRTSSRNGRRGDIEQLQAPVNGENGQTALERILSAANSHWSRRRSGFQDEGLARPAKKFLANVVPAREKKRVHLLKATGRRAALCSVICGRVAMG
jgi:hypothetical protein